MGLVAIPVLALLVPDRLPQAIVLASLPLALFMLWHERNAIQLHRTTWLLVGQFVGVAPAILVLAVVPVRVLQGVFAVATLATVVLMVTLRVSIRSTPRNQLVAGVLSGFIGTAAGLGGPPVALLYAHESGRKLRATMALVLLASTVFSIIGYWSGGRLTQDDLALGAALLVPVVLGLWIGVLVREHLHGPRLRRAVFLLITISALVLLSRAVTG